MAGALAVAVRIYQPIPKAKSSRRCMVQIERGELRPTTRPDADNCIKAALDALEGVAYQNDSQIVSLRAEKHYSERPRMEIEVEGIEGHA